MAEPIGYTADLDPHGRVNGYEFHLDDGSSLYSFGPHADALARDIDSMPDTRTADASPVGAPFQVPQMGGGLEAPISPQEVADVAPGVPVAPPPPRVAPGWATEPGGQPGSVDKTPQGLQLQRGAVAAGKPVVDLASAPELPMRRGPGGGGAPGEFDAEINARTPYSPGVSPQQMISRGAYVPSERTTEEAVPYDAQAAFDRADAEDSLWEAQRNRTDFEVAKLAEEAKILKAQQPALVQGALEAKRAETEADNRYRDQRTHLQGLIDAQRARRVDPNQFFAEKGTLGTIGIVLAQALGQWAASQGHTQNYVGQVINDAIEHSIRAQEAAIASGQQGINNALGELEREYGDRDMAKQALRIVLHDVADNKAREVAAQLGTKEAELNLQAWYAGRDKLRADEEAKFRALSMGKEKTVEKFTQPKAGGGGGPLSIFERAKREEAATKIVEARRKRSGGFEGLDEKQDKLAEELSKRMEPITDAKNAIADVRNAGLEENVTLPVPDVAAGAAALVGLPKLENQRSATNRYVAAYSKAMTGLGGSEPQRLQFERNVKGSLSAKSTREASLRQAERDVAEKRRTVLRGYPEAVRKAWATREGQVLDEEEKGATKAK